MSNIVEFPGLYLAGASRTNFSQVIWRQSYIFVLCLIDFCTHKTSAMLRRCTVFSPCRKHAEFIPFT